MSFIVNIFNIQTTNQILISLTVGVMLSLLSMKESKQVLCLFDHIDLSINSLSYKYAGVRSTS
jgi:hypothetical protein